MLNPTPSPDELRSYAKDADDHGNHWVPISPSTLRALADLIERFEVTLDSMTASMNELRPRPRVPFPQPEWPFPTHGGAGAGVV